MIELHGITKTFPSKVGNKTVEIKPLDNVCLDIEDGKIVGLVGESGSGKSTLANILCGICAPSDGKVYVDGKSLWSDKGKYDRKAGSSIQLIPQKPLLALDPTERAGSAVKEALVAFKHAKRGKDAKDKTYMLFDTVGLEHTLASRLPMHLSGGQAQRVVIARALATRPRLLISDESTSMLDEESQESILNLYKNIVKSEGISLLLITHDVDTALRFCDVVYALKDGKLSVLNAE